MEQLKKRVNSRIDDLQDSETMNILDGFVVIISCVDVWFFTDTESTEESSGGTLDTFR